MLDESSWMSHLVPAKNGQFAARMLQQQQLAAWRQNPSQFLQGLQWVWEDAHAECVHDAVKAVVSKR